MPKPRTFEALYRDREIREESKGAPFVGIRLEAGTPAPVRTKGSPVGKAEVPRSKHTIHRDRRGDAGADAKSKKRVRKAG